MRSGWKEMSERWWWRENYGSVVLTASGWVSSRSGYDHIVLSPSFGPFKSPAAAAKALEEHLLERQA